MKTLPFSRFRTGIFVLSFIILALGIGYRLGERRLIPQISGIQGVSNTSSTSTQIIGKDSTSSTADFSLFWDVWDKLNRYFVDAKDLDEQKMIYGAISGMVASAGDPYTSFFPPKENKEFKEDIGGEFEGIGAQLDLKDGRIVILSPLKKSPAEAAGLKPGDYILKVNDEDTAGWTIQQAVSKIRGKKGTTVNLEILHENSREPIVISVVRNTILVPSVESWVKPVSSVTEIRQATEAASFRTNNARVAYIKLSRFGDHTNEDWNVAIKDIVAEHRKQPLKGVVFDMRYNPGGYLEGAVFIASEFIKSGTVVVQKNSDGSENKLNVNRKGQLTDMPMVVIVNKGSASAAEIVAGALKDYNRATIVGETTFGKGSVQTPYELTQGASVHITTGKWFTPNGESIAEKGITPDTVVLQSSVSELNVTENDVQLAKAIELLLQ